MSVRMKVTDEGRTREYDTGHIVDYVELDESPYERVVVREQDDGRVSIVAERVDGDDVQFTASQPEKAYVGLVPSEDLDDIDTDIQKILNYISFTLVADFGTDATDRSDSAASSSTNADDDEFE